jgi:hypothetical protein
MNERVFNDIRKYLQDNVNVLLEMYIEDKYVFFFIIVVFDNAKFKLLTQVLDYDYYAVTKLFYDKHTHNIEKLESHINDWEDLLYNKIGYIPSEIINKVELSYIDDREKMLEMLEKDVLKSKTALEDFLKD